MMADMGPCPLCGRPLIEGASIDRHHLVPRAHGGKETTHLHRVCHTKVHSVFTEKELEKTHNTVEALLENPDIQAFVKWVSKKDPEFCDQSADTKRRKRKRRR